MACTRIHIGGCGIAPGRLRTVLIAPDSFKGSLSAHEAARCMAEGVRDALPGATIFTVPVSDGGEGLVDVLTPSLGGVVRETLVAGPLPGRRVRAKWGFAASRSLAVLEMAQASGLTLVSPRERNVLVSTTRGVGELILAALDTGAQELIVGIGGSATNDGGAGMAEALGARFFDHRGSPLGPGGAALRNLARIDLTDFDARVRRARIIVACDVQNPLIGPEGASSVYGPQKGADPAAVKTLEEGLRRYRDVLLETVGVDVQTVPGSGAAGGLGAGLVALCGAVLRPGITLVLDAVGFDARLREADIVVTGEGKLDSQTRAGKALAGILDASHRLRRPVLAVVGSMNGSPGDFTRPEGFAGVATLVSPDVSKDEAIARAGPLLRQRTTELLQSFASTH